MSASPRSCSALKCPPARATAARTASRPPASRPEKTLEEFDFSLQRSVRKTIIEHLGQLDFLHARENVILLGPPGTGRTHLAIASSIRACLAGQRVQFPTATQWVARLSELKRRSFIPRIVVDGVGYIPFDPEAANLMFSLVSNRDERASMIVTSNPPLRDPRAQRRQLPPARQGPRRPHRGQRRRNRLTDHPRAPRRGPQNPAQRAGHRPDPDRDG
jgi:hypothetical protein